MGWERSPSVARTRGIYEESVWTLDRWMEAGQGGAHRRWWAVLAWFNMDGGGDGWWWWNLGQNNRTTKDISYTERIEEWRGATVASQRRVGSGVSPQHWRKAVKGGGDFGLPVAFIAGGERKYRCRPAHRRRWAGGTIGTCESPALGPYLVGLGRSLNRRRSVSSLGAALFIGLAR
jgi:hypothetical protein